MKKTTAFIVSLLFLTTAIYADNNKEDSIKIVFQKLSSAIESGDPLLLKEDLSDRFSISIASYPSSANSYLNTVIGSKKATSVKYLNIQSTGDTTIVNSEFTLSNGKTAESIIAFDQQNKLLFVDFFDTFYSPSRYSKSELVGTIPFERDSTSIFLTLKINDSEKKVRFLLDTGADGMAINPTLAKEIGLKPTQENEAKVVGGTVKTQIASGNTIHLSDDIILKNQRIAIISGLPADFDGIIGLNVARQHIVTIDNENKNLILRSFGDYEFSDKGEVVDITVPGGIIIISGVINVTGKKEVLGNFVLDSGANYYLVCFEKFVRKNRLLLSGFKSEGLISIASMGVQSSAYRGNASKVKVGEKTSLENIQVVLQASSSKVDGEHPDGSLGIKFINRHNITIDMLRKKVQFVPISNPSLSLKSM